MFEIGKKVVALVSHEQGCFKEGEIYTIDDVSHNICKCKRLTIGIGFKGNGTQWCSECNTYNIKTGNSCHFMASYFRPIDYDFADQVLEQIFEKELCPAK